MQEAATRCNARGVQCAPALSWVPAVNGIEVVDIAHAIQLALAPVFLLSGIWVFLGVLASRLARIVDRARGMEKELRLSEARDPEQVRNQ